MADALDLRRHRRAAPDARHRPLLEAAVSRQGRRGLQTRSPPRPSVSAILAAVSLGGTGAQSTISPSRAQRGLHRSDRLRRRWRIWHCPLTTLHAACTRKRATAAARDEARCRRLPRTASSAASSRPRTGVDGRHYETRFELRLPTAWTNRFFYQGGGGNDGNVGRAVGRNTGCVPEVALQRGFAVVSTDAGHQGAGRGVRARSRGQDRPRVSRARPHGNRREGAHRSATTAAVRLEELFRRLLGRWPPGHDVLAALSRLLRRHRRSARRR